MRELGDAIQTCALLAFIAVLVVHCTPAASAERFPGPFAAEVVRVIDADTVELDVAVWPGQTVRVGLRIDGIDTPESRRADCPAEKVFGKEASAFVSGLLLPGSTVRVLDLFEGKYAGRVVGSLAVPQGDDPEHPELDLAELLVGRGFAQAYDGGTRPDWCAILRGRERGG